MSSRFPRTSLRGSAALPRFALDVAAAPDPGESAWKVTTPADRPELLQQVCEVALETYGDQPGREDANIGEIDDWCSYAYDPNPKDAFVVALAWRGRGIADAINRAHIRWAKANGLCVLPTANEVRIPAISRLNERYGYRSEPAEIVMRGPCAALD